MTFAQLNLEPGLRVNRGAASEERKTLEMASPERLIGKSITMSSRDLDVASARQDYSELIYDPARRSMRSDAADHLTSAMARSDHLVKAAGRHKMDHPSCRAQ